MDALKLKHWALILETELEANKGRSKDVSELAIYEPLVEAIEMAKREEISHPIDIPAMQHWSFETDIPSFKGVSHALSCFRILLWGWELPKEKNE